MMKVYIAFEEFPHEGRNILGVYATEDDAEKEISERKEKDETNGYNDFYVDWYEVQ